VTGAEDTGVEWVIGPQGWWIPWFGPGLVALPPVAVLLAYILRDWGRNFPIAFSYYLLAVAILLGSICVQFALRWWFPSVRRLGIAPWGLVVDVGLRRIRYPWHRLHKVVRTRATTNLRGRLTTDFRTRTVLGPDVLRTFLTLSATQGDRLAQVLQLD
jgi:hypothetical protein